MCLFVLRQRFCTYRTTCQAPAATTGVFSTSGTRRWVIMPAKAPLQTRNASPLSLVSSAQRTPLRPKTCMTTSSAPANTHSSIRLARSPVVYCSPPHFRLISTVASSPVVLRLVSEEDGHRLCMGNWNSSQVTHLDQVVHSTDSVQALSESLLSLSKHLVNRIDSIWAAPQQAAFYNIVSTTQEADPAHFEPCSASVSSPVLMLRSHPLFFPPRSRPGK